VAAGHTRSTGTRRGFGGPGLDGATELLLIRHGESARAAPGQDEPITGDHADPALTPLGQEQADRLAARLAGTSIQAIYVTPLRRTRQTARPLAAHLGLPMLMAEGLIEVHLGEWEGRYREMVDQRHPLVGQVWSEERWDVIPGAEPAAAFAARVHAAVEEVARAHRGERVAVFAHGGVIGQVLADAARSRPFAFLPSANTGISGLLVAGEHWAIRSFNDTAHLGTHFDSPGAALPAQGRGPLAQEPREPVPSTD
jgi:probable phosphoglycerate mutase